MNILCVDQYGSLGGAQRCLLDLLPAFVNRHWNVGLAAPIDGSLTSHAETLGCRIEPLRSRQLSSYRKSAAEIAQYTTMVPSWVARLKHAVRAHQIQLLYVNGPRILPAAALIARLHSIPMVFHAHHRLTQSSAIRITAAALHYARASVIACSRFVADSFDRFDGVVRVIYNGVSDSRICETNRRNTHPIVGVIGRIDREKGQLEFIRAAQLIHSVMPEVRFRVVGSPLFGNDVYYEQLLHESEGLPVTFAGWTDQVAKALSELDVLVVPSPGTEATPRIILEAFSAGVPVVSFRSDGIAEILKHKETGFLVETRSPEALAGSISDLLRGSSETTRSIIENARAAWVEHFQLDRFRHDVCEILETEYQEHASTR
ncbi:MAG TPA: glycosyltransferase family 4 protein [Bryobacteraceae bacterium]|jgi:glycosyltransferase involved in cell wall biosynthesis|nr:glycosyltransferase family 4 protein [Bryobacteraceae bacterium]